MFFSNLLYCLSRVLRTSRGWLRLSIRQGQLVLSRCGAHQGLCLPFCHLIRWLLSQHGLCYEDSRRLSKEMEEGRLVRRKIPNGTRVEPLMYAELVQRRQEEEGGAPMPPCSNRRMEWFKTDVGVVKEVVDGCATWIRGRPYDDKARLIHCPP